jgi:hypothetical protein
LVKIIRNYFVKRSFRKDFIIIFLEEKIGFKRNHIKKTMARLWRDWLALWEKWVTALGRCGRETR